MKKIFNNLLFASVLITLMYLSNYNTYAYTWTDPYNSDKEIFGELKKNSCTHFPIHKIVNKYYNSQSEANLAPDTITYIPDEGLGLFKGKLNKIRVQYISPGKYVAIYEGYVCLQ
ncbi:hypothetical protein [Helcococcus bovis]|uniref:hypothetical protein n=1 Tax=Helcococcus bovis TaxID=3153252 RepID=UPI0038BCCB45